MAAESLTDQQRKTLRNRSGLLKIYLIFKVVFFLMLALYAQDKATQGKELFSYAHIWFYAVSVFYVIFYIDARRVLKLLEQALT